MALNLSFIIRDNPYALANACNNDFYLNGVEVLDSGLWCLHFDINDWFETEDESKAKYMEVNYNPYTGEAISFSLILKNNVTIGTQPVTRKYLVSQDDRLHHLFVTTDAADSARQLVRQLMKYRPNEVDDFWRISPSQYGENIYTNFWDDHVEIDDVDVYDVLNEGGWDQHIHDTRTHSLFSQESK